MDYKPYPYQEAAEQWIIDHPACGLFLEMGLGKTVITLSAIRRLLDSFEVGRVLVVAPLRVAATVWAEEARKWDHLHGLRCVKVLGERDARLSALKQEADIYIINRENVPWLCEQYSADRWPFDMVVLDELSSFKSTKAARFRALKRLRPVIRRVVGLTGTPAPNGLLDLWAQIYLLDQGKRLGSTMGGFRERYFTEGRRNANVVYEWRPKAGAEKAISGLLKDICISMTAEDYLTMPDRLDRVVRVPLEGPARFVYEKMEKDMLLPLDGELITAQTAAVVTGKLLQLANGAIYDAERRMHIVHDEKVNVLADLIEEANGQPVLVYYAFQHDLRHIKERFRSARVLQDPQDVIDWNEGRIPLLLAHPDSAGHGLNLQQGGHILIWFGLTWSLERYQQANARLYRQGQKQPVTIFHLVAEGTIDETVIKVLQGKEKRQDALIEAVKARIEKAAR